MSQRRENDFLVKLTGFVKYIILNFSKNVTENGLEYMLGSDEESAFGLERMMRL